MMSEIQKMVGERIRHFRKEKGLSQEDLASLANLHATYIGQLERGEKNPTLNSMLKIADALGISLEQLFQAMEMNNESKDYTLIKIITFLQTKSVEEQKFVLKFLQMLFEWKKF